MLGLAPDNQGLLPESDVARLKEFGGALHNRYANNLTLHRLPTSKAEDSALDNDPDTFWSAPAGSHHATIEVSFSKPIDFDRAVTMEWLNDGQHVQRYAIEAWLDGKWKRIAGGEAIGHKKIDGFALVTTSKVRLNILSSTSEAHIREFQIYRSGALPSK